ncbi:hypothetical protein A2368_01865 [Candidatus Collierbacteria bacterium RIFOXYB1_FULL_49_13]|uniref:Glycosyl transferase n=1 Tax=Candidatus Collierbacteria bacterium RIFOXYB1_FULL_49_13 TaxID=1817728 RepID=A0A1F5FEK6_9BACT|nr:MAG: hypothetical protein A2368_01865 [Candidatus Collierbacteria bacterium RIFOXYB1_FULL_49_13]
MKNTSSKTEKIGGSRAVIFGIPIFSSRRGELIKGLESVLSEKTGKCLIYTPNPEILVESKQNPELAQALKSAEVNIPDGIGVVLANRVMARLGRSDVRIQERIAGADLAEDLVRICAARGKTVMLLGGQEGVASLAARRLSDKYKGLQVVETQGYQDVLKPTGKEEDLVVEMVRKHKPGLLLVAFGQGKQERWLTGHRDLPFVIGMGVGGTLDFWSGHRSRAPLVLRQIGLEWLYRLIREPWRWRRQLRLLKFVGLVVKEITS